MRNIKRVLRNVISTLFNNGRKLFVKPPAQDIVYLLSAQAAPDQIADIQHRLDFYVPGKKLVHSSRLSLQIVLGSHPILTMGFSRTLRRLNSVRGGIFNIDYDHNPTAATKFCKLAEYCAEIKVNTTESKQRFQLYVDALREQKLDKAYVFGTGPSLAGAMELDWSDGYRIVCNTIVRDPELWHHIDPHFIVAGDALYHFSYTQFARVFRADLARRLSEGNAFFVYPAHFHQIVIREFAAYSTRLIPVPTGRHSKIFADLTQVYNLPGFGNVLPWLLLPVACTLSKDISLYGFDGRAPTDQLFWSNSTKHSYPEYMPELQQAFPAFFSHYVPQDNPEKYVKSVHGDVLEHALQTAEQAGWSFRMLHESWTPTLQKRYTPLQTVANRNT